MVNKKKSAYKSHHNKCPLTLFSIDDYPESVPAAGYRNGTSLNNAGSNGYYWSSTPNSNNNAYNLNFNSSSHNVNNNNRNNGYTVRPVRELTKESLSENKVRHFSITNVET